MIGQDLKFAWRTYRSRPGFTLAIILTLGLGIGANATIFSWIDAVVLSPLPSVSKPSELSLLRFASPTRSDLSWSYPNYRDMRDQTPKGLTGVAVFAQLPLGLRTTGEPERVWSQVVSGNFFDVLNVSASRGRVLQPADEAAIGASPVAVISDRLWRNRFGAREDIAGTSVNLNGHPFTVVGVAAPGFVGSIPGLAMDMFVPVTMHQVLTGRTALEARGNGWLMAITRKDNTVSDAALNASVKGIGDRYAQNKLVPATWTMRVAPMREAGAATVLFPVLAVVMGVVGIVLLIACANVSSLLLSRAIARQREIAVRASLGATRMRLIRQMLIESFGLSVLGGIAGIAIATWTTSALMTLMPPMPFPVLIDASVNMRVLGFSALVVAGATIIFGLAPALQGSRTQLQQTLRTSGSNSTGPRTLLRRGLVAAQIALATVLLISAGLFVRTLSHAYTADPGFARRESVLAAFDLSSIGYDADKGRAFYDTLLERLETLPNVESATVGTVLPLAIGGGSDTSPIIDGYDTKKDEEVVVYYGMVGPRYFETMGTPVVSGRAIDATDRSTSQNVVVINQTMARRYWAGRDPIGGRLKTGGDWITVVGVAKDAKYGSLTEAPRSMMYFPIAQTYRSNPVLQVATRGAAASAIADIRKTIASVAPELAIYDVRTMSDHLQTSVAVPRLGAILLGVFGGLALTLAAIGLYGVVAFAVTQRTREIGVRIALGAERGTILRQVLGDAGRTSALGLAIGVALALAASPALSSMMVGVSPRDITTYIATSSVLLAVSMLASWLPARKAASIDPVKALRAE